MEPNTNGSEAVTVPQLAAALERGEITRQQLAELMGLQPLTERPERRRPPLDLRRCAAEQLERQAVDEPRTGPAVEPVDEVTAGIIRQIYEALTALGADSKLLGVVGSWRDTLPDLHVLAGLRAWNAQRAAAAPPSLKDREPERQRGLLTDDEWAMVDHAAAPVTATAKGEGGQAS